MGRTTSWLALLACLVLGGTSTAQELSRDEARVGEWLQAVEDHDRAELHPAEDPLVIVGREQGDNDLRARTPMLARGQRVPAQVDPEEAYERALALHEGTRFRSPPRGVGKSDANETRTPADRKRSPATEAPAEGAGGSARWPWLTAMLAAALGLGFLFRRLLAR